MADLKTEVIEFCAKGATLFESFLKSKDFLIIKIPKTVQNKKSEVWILWNFHYKVFGNVWVSGTRNDKIEDFVLYITSRKSGCKTVSLIKKTEVDLQNVLISQLKEEAMPSQAPIDFGFYSGASEKQRKRRMALMFTTFPKELREALTGHPCEKAYLEMISPKRSKLLIVLEGLDGSGKQTQAEILTNGWEGKVKKVSFPNYESDSSTLIKMYLRGDFGNDPKRINPYTVSAFYAVDRAASLKLWKDDYEHGLPIIADRYATSNMIYQMAKLPSSEWESYLEWEKDFEYCKMQIPKPDMVFFLDVPENEADKLLEKRYSKQGEKDIHEKDREYQRLCRKAALYAAEKEGWIVIPCYGEGEMLSAIDIQERIKRYL